MIKCLISIYHDKEYKIFLDTLKMKRAFLQNADINLVISYINNNVILVLCLLPLIKGSKIDIF